MGDDILLKVVDYGACIDQKDLNRILVEPLNGIPTIKYMKQNHVDMIVLDMIMEPGIDSLDTSKGIVTISLAIKCAFSR